VRDVPQVTKPYTFQNQTIADAGQVNQNFDALFNAINGNLDSANIKAGGITTTNLANEAVTPAKTEGIPYAQDLFSNGFILNGLTVTKDGSIQNQVNVTAGVVYVKQADGTLRRFAPTATNFRTSTPNNTYYLDFQPDGTWWWNTGHSQQANYINVATVTSDASANVATVTQNQSAYNVTLPGTSNVNVLTNPLYRLGL
jgi:hypothetical protein